MARISGWLVVALLLVAAALMVGVRLHHGSRPAPHSGIATWHMRLGLLTAAAAFAHTLMGVFMLGTPGAIAAGELALAAGALSFGILLAHTGIGLQLRDPKLRQRPQKRRTHVITAASITLAALLHALLLLGAR